MTLSPCTLTLTEPPLEEAWYPKTSFLPRRPPQKSPRPQCAEPVTGSSLIPTLGPKNLETKSYPLAFVEALGKQVTGDSPNGQGLQEREIR